MIAAVLGLVFSLLGTLTHMIKSSLILTQLATRWHFKSTATKTLFIVSILSGLLAIAPILIHIPLTENPTYRSWIGGNETIGRQGASLNYGIARTIDSVIRIESIAYPAFSSIENAFDSLWKAMGAARLDRTIMRII